MLEFLKEHFVITAGDIIGFIALGVCVSLMLFAGVVIGALSLLNRFKRCNKK